MERVELFGGWLRCVDGGRESGNAGWAARRKFERKNASFNISDDECGS